VSGVNEVNGMRAVDHLGEGDVEEGVLDVEMVHKPTLEIANVSIVWTVVGFMIGLKVLS
jgi:hypothetical protein